MTRKLAVLIGISFVYSAIPASAQSSLYVTGTGFAEMKSFSENESGPDIGGGDDESDLDGTKPGGGLRIGTFLHPRWSLELAVDMGGKSEGSTLPYRILAGAPSSLSLRVPDFKESVRFLTVSTVVGYHPAPHGRIRPGYLFGFSFIQGTYKTQYPNYYAIAAGALGSLSVGSGQLSPTIYPPLPITISTLTSTENIGAAILGFETAIDLGRHLAVVPEIRALAFSSNFRGDGVFLIRPGVGLRWNF